MLWLQRRKSVLELDLDLQLRLHRLSYQVGSEKLLLLGPGLAPGFRLRLELFGHALKVDLAWVLVG